MSSDHRWGLISSSRINAQHKSLVFIHWVTVCIRGSELSQYFLDERSGGQQAGGTSVTASTPCMKQISESHLFQLFWFYRHHWESRIHQDPPEDQCHWDSLNLLTYGLPHVDATIAACHTAETWLGHCNPGCKHRLTGCQAKHAAAFPPPAEYTQEGLRSCPGSQILCQMYTACAWHWISYASQRG